MKTPIIFGPFFRSWEGLLKCYKVLYATIYTVYPPGDPFRIGPSGLSWGATDRAPGGGPLLTISLIYIYYYISIYT